MGACGEVTREDTHAAEPALEGGGILNRNMVAALLALIGVFSVCAASAQQGKAYRIGIVREGGPDYAAIEGLKEGLKELGLVEGKEYVLEGRDLQGDASGLRAAAGDFERQRSTSSTRSRRR